jgi:hypothetical protein
MGGKQLQRSGLKDLNGDLQPMHVPLVGCPPPGLLLRSAPGALTRRAGANDEGPGVRAPRRLRASAELASRYCAARRRRAASRRATTGGGASCGGSTRIARDVRWSTSPAAGQGRAAPALPPPPARAKGPQAPASTWRLRS